MSLGTDIAHGDVHLRRATSTAYYALFHHVCEAAALRFAGIEVAATDAYRAFYRAYDHARMRSACEAFTRDKATDVDLKFFADTFVRLQVLRHLADDDPVVNFTGRDLVALITEAESAIQAFERLRAPVKTVALASMVFKVRV